MGFLQLVEFKTDSYDEIRKLDDEWYAATEGKRTAQKAYVCRDRNDPQRYVIAVLFDSYESAMANSNLPETQKFAALYQDKTSGTTFQDLDVIEERT